MDVRGTGRLLLSGERFGMGGVEATEAEDREALVEQGGNISRRA